MPKFRIGTDDFKKLRDNEGYFVDKTLFIRDIIEGNDVTLIPRPRRFGKTLNISMLKYFFEQSEESMRYLFQECEIARYPEYMSHQGQYPVIFISLKDVKGASWQESRVRIIEKITGLAIRLEYLHPSLHPFHRQKYETLCSEDPDDAIVKASLKNIIEWLYSYHNRPVVVLIDEYDSPMIEAFSHGYYREMAEFMRSWLGAGLKPENGQALYRAVVTGILRIAKESIFSDLNNLDVASSLMISPFADKFGFTEPEIELILTAFKAEGHAEIISDWYNGYSFGGHTIYNPWSVISYIAAIPNLPGPKWLNTSSNALVYEELATGGVEVTKDLEVLLKGEELRYPINETITFSDIGKKPLNIWSFLYHTGYLKASDPKWAEYDPDLLTYSLAIPNREITLAYRQFINRLYETGKQGSGIQEFIWFFTKERPEARILESILQDLTLALLSMYDLAKLPEAVFHAFVLGLLANMRNVYEIRSNAEAGYGRADILMIPRTGGYQTGYIIEFKTIGERVDDERISSDALDQIRNKEYQVALINAGVKEDTIVHLAITLQGKKITVQKKVNPSLSNDFR